MRSQIANLKNISHVALDEDVTETNRGWKTIRNGDLPCLHAIMRQEGGRSRRHLQIPVSNDQKNKQQQ